MNEPHPETVAAPRPRPRQRRPGRRGASAPPTAAGRASTTRCSAACPLGRRRAVALVNRLPGSDVLGGRRRHRPRPAALPTRTGGSPASTSRPRCWRRPASAWPTARSPTSTRCARWTPRRPTSRTPRSTSRWRCSWPRWCRIRARCWRRCGGWCGRAATSCSSAISPPRTGRCWWIERGLAPASRALGWHPDFAAEALFAPEDLRAHHRDAGAAVRHLQAGPPDELIAAARERAGSAPQRRSLRAGP